MIIPELALVPYWLKEYISSIASAVILGLLLVWNWHVTSRIKAQATPPKTGIYRILPVYSVWINDAQITPNKTENVRTGQWKILIVIAWLLLAVSLYGLFFTKLYYGRWMIALGLIANSLMLLYRWLVVPARIVIRSQGLQTPKGFISFEQIQEITHNPEFNELRVRYSPNLNNSYVKTYYAGLINKDDYSLLGQYLREIRGNSNSP